MLVSSGEETHTVYIGSGSNIGDRLANLRRAFTMLDELPHTSVLKVSHVYHSEPHGDVCQEWFYNAAVKVRTRLSPQRLLFHCKKIEALMGRPAEPVRWGSRIIDLDILLYDELNCSLEYLTIPHPELHNRKFVLFPLLDLANPVHPVLDKNMRELLESCPDTSSIERLEERVESFWKNSR